MSRESTFASRARGLQGLVCLSFVSATALASARAPRQITLHYTRAPDALTCADPIALTRKVEGLTGPVLVAPGSAEVALEVHVEAKRPRGFRARLSLGREGESPQGERVLEIDSPDCRNFDDTLALVIATAVDPDSVLERLDAVLQLDPTAPERALLAELSAQGDRPAPAKAAAQPAPPPPQTPAVARVQPKRRLVGAGLAASNELPSPALGPALQVRFGEGRWLDLGASARTVFALGASAVDTSWYDGGPDSAGGRRPRVGAFQASAALLVCPRFPLEHIVLSTCIGPELSVLRATGSGFSSNERAVGTTLGATVRPELTLKLSERATYVDLSLALFARVGARNRLTSEYEGMSRVFFSTPILTAGAELSIRLGF